MKKLEVSDFWLWLSNSRMRGTALYSSLDLPLMDANDNTNSGVVPVLKAETGREVEPARLCLLSSGFLETTPRMVCFYLIYEYWVRWPPLLQGSLEKHIFSFENRKRKTGKMASGFTNPKWIPYFLIHLIPSLFSGPALGLIFATISRGAYHSAEYLEYEDGQLYG